MMEVSNIYLAAKALHDLVKSAPLNPFALNRTLNVHRRTDAYSLFDPVGGLCDAL